MNCFYYASPLGKILLSSNDAGLTGLWFEGQKYYASTLPQEYDLQRDKFIDSAVSWLDIYFSGKVPDFTPSLSLIGTDFRKEVWEILLSIPYGKTISYGEIAAIIAKRRGIDRFSSRAVGGAVGHNPISIIVPCHRVIGSDGTLTGYAGGEERKLSLLKIEGIF